MERKIGYITSCKYEDSGNASGVPATMYRALKEQYEVYPIVVESTAKRWRNRMVKLLSFGKIKNTHTTFWVERLILEQKVKKTIREGVRVFVAPMCAPLAAELTRLKETYDIRIITRSDATYHLLHDFYWMNESKMDQKNGDHTEKRALENATVAILTTEWAAADAINYYGISKDKIRIIPFGTSLTDCFTPVQRNNYVPGDTIRFLLVGKDYERKGVDIAIKCIRHLNKMQSEYKFELTVVGAKNEKGIEDPYIVWIGMIHCNEDEKPLIALYQSADAFILPSIAECMGLSFIEAAMYGLPIFAYDVGGAASVIEHEKTGILMQPNAGAEEFALAILQSLKAGKWNEWSVNARAKYESEFAPEVWKSKLFAAIEEAYR